MSTYHHHSPASNVVNWKSSSCTLVFSDGIALPLAPKLILALLVVSRVLDRRVPPKETFTNLGVVGNVGQDAGDQAHVHEGQPSMARCPAKVLVTVCVELCSTCQSPAAESPGAFFATKAKETHCLRNALRQNVFRA